MPFRRFVFFSEKGKRVRHVADSDDASSSQT